MNLISLIPIVFTIIFGIIVLSFAVRAIKSH